MGFAHWCSMDHQPIGHNDSEYEECPLCRMMNERDDLQGLVEVAYLEGWSAGFQTDRDDYMYAGEIRDRDWSQSTARALLNEETE